MQKVSAAPWESLKKKKKKIGADVHEDYYAEKQTSSIKIIYFQFNFTLWKSTKSS